MGRTYLDKECTCAASREATIYWAIYYIVCCIPRILVFSNNACVGMWTDARQAKIEKGVDDVYEDGGARRKGRRVLSDRSA